MKNRVVFSVLAIMFAVATGLTMMQSCQEKDPVSVQGNIEGTVLDSETGQAVSGVNVNIVSNSSTTFAEQSKTTGSDGKFSFKDLEAGSYKLTFRKTGYTDNSKNITLAAGQTSSSDVSLVPVKSTISVTPTLLDFGQNTNILPVEIRNTGQGDLNWSIVEDLPWLSVNPVSGKTTSEPTAVTVTIDRSLITEDSKTGSFVVNSNGGSVMVNVTAGKAGPVLSITPASLDFGQTEIEKTLNLSNIGAGTLTYTATAGQSWITLENATGSATTDIKTVKVKVNRAGMSTGDYSGSVVVNSNSNSVSIPVTMSIMEATAPDVLNGQASAVKHNSAQVAATIVSLGSSAVTQHGHCWSTSPAPTTANNKTSLGGTSVNYSYTSNLTGLTHSTTYYVRAYAVNAVGTKYSEQITFTTLAPPTMATVKTLMIENVLHNSVDASGELTVLGDGFVTDHGFCYSSSNASPTTADLKTSLGSTTALGGFAGTVTGLKESTKYFIRAYAVNSMGTAYGNVVETTTVEAPPLVTAGLIAYYTFDNSNCNESRGNSQYNGIKQGSGNPVWSTDIPNKSGKSLQLSNDVFFQMPTNPMSRDVQYSYSVWLKTVNSGTVWQHQGSKHNYCPGLAISNNKVSAFSYYQYASITTANYVYFDIDISQLLLDGGWHLLTITRNGENHKLYIDGTYYAIHSFGSGFSNNPYPLQLGNGFIGKMDNVRYYNREITAAEIKELFDAKQ
jgi:5-hydroxyisourate hydrolase-like protein (transthyretin family)